MSVNRMFNYSNDPNKQTVTYYETLEIPWPKRLIKTQKRTSFGKKLTKNFGKKSKELQVM